MAVIAACSSVPPSAAHKSCSAIGAYSGVNVTIESGLLPPTTEAVAVKACLARVCKTFDAQNAPEVVVPIPSVPNGNVTVSVSLIAKGRTVFDGTTTVRTIKRQPNGPGCEPTVWQATVTARANGQLTG